MGSMALLAGARGAGAHTAAARTGLARCWAAHSTTSIVAASRYSSPHSQPPSSIAAYSRQHIHTSSASRSKHSSPTISRVLSRHPAKWVHRDEMYDDADDQDQTHHSGAWPPRNQLGHQGLGRSRPRRIAEDESEQDRLPDDNQRHQPRDNPNRYQDPDEFFSERHLTQHPDLLAAAEETEPAPRETIHILGGNNQATYLAHMLSHLPSNPAVHIIHVGYHQSRKWDDEGGRVNVVRGNGILPNNPVIGEYTGPGRKPWRRRYDDMPQSFYTPLQPIEHLIVTMSCVHSIRAFESIAHRINHRTTICLVQGGLGVAERLNELYFPDIPSRPTYLLAHMTHSLGYTDRPFTVVELEPGRMVFTRYTPADQIAEEVGPASTADHDFDADSATAAAEDDRDFDAIISDGENGASSRAPPQFVPELPPAQEMEFDSDEVLELERNNGMRLMYLLGVTPELGAGGYSIAAYLRYKLPELVYTAAVEPVATALDLAVSNAFWSNGHACSIMEDLVAEMVEVIKHLPETRSSKRLSDYVNSGELERKVHRMSFSLAHKEGRLLAPASNVVAASYSEVGETWGNKAPAQDPGSDVFCLMARRTALGQRTDIEFLNGYFVRRGKALGIACPMNEMVIKMVRAKRKDSMARPFNQVYPGSLGRPTPIPFVTPKGPFTPAAGKFGASPDSGYQEFLKDHEEQQRQQYGRDHEIGNEEEDQYSENWA